MRVRLEDGTDHDYPAFLAALHDGRIAPLSNVSFDYGKTWTTATAAAKRIREKRVGTEALSTLVPDGWDLYAAYSLWVGLFWGLFFALPVGLLAGLYGGQAHSPGKQLLWVAGALLTGTAPMIALGVITRWSVNRSHLRGGGVAWYCFIIAALSVIEMVAFRGVM